jgi:hypothetical protein
MSVASKLSQPSLSKPNLSQDGELRFDVSIKHRIGVETLVAAVVLGFFEGRECDVPYTDPEKGERLDRRRITKSSVSAVVRQYLKEGRNKLDYWSDDIEDYEEAGAWAEAHVLRLWPELKR